MSGAGRAAFWIILLCVRSLSGADNFAALQTELKMQSVGVAVRAPLGWRYHPGEMFPLEFFVDNPGAPQRVSFELTEVARDGSGAFAERAELPAPVILPTGRSRHTLPVRAEPLSSGLSLSLRAAPADGGTGSELFRASLSRMLSPLPKGGRVIVLCGGVLASTAHGPDDATAKLSARELPTEAWMWEGVDWLVLSDASIKEARPEVREAVRQWLLGGGHLFLGSQEALSAAHALNLLPVAANVPLESGVNWWQRNVGLRAADILAEHSFRPVYARARSGFGTVVFLFPGAASDDADGAAVFNREDLQRQRFARADPRVEDFHFDAFGPDALGNARARGVVFWSLLGALLFCAALLYAHTSRSWLESALLPLATGGLSCALLAQGLPAGNVSVSRIRISEHSRDGRCAALEEWDSLEAFQRPEKVSALGAPQAALLPVFTDSDDLRAAGLTRRVDDGRESLVGISCAPNQPALLRARKDFFTEPHAETAPGETLNYLVEGVQQSVALPANLPPSMLHATRLLLVLKDGGRWLLKRENPSEVFSTVRLQDGKRIGIQPDIEYIESEYGFKNGNGVMGNRSAALYWACWNALQRGGSALIGWSDVEENRAPVRLLEITPKPQLGADFFVQIYFLPEPR